MRHGPPTVQPAPSLAGRRGGRRRPRRAARRPDPGRADPRPRRPPGPGLSRPDLDAGPVPRRRLRVRAADGAALLAAQHARLPADRAHLAPQRPAASRAMAHRPYQPRASARPTILHGVEIPSAGGGTTVASMPAPYL